jgi:hypothetical protein
MIRFYKISKEKIDSLQENWDNLRKDDAGNAEIIVSDLALPEWYDAKESNAYLKGYKEAKDSMKITLFVVSVGLTFTISVALLVGVYLNV